MTKNEGTLDDGYFEWLYSFVGAVRNRNPSRSYWSLLKKLYSTPFHWFVPNDDNRAEDGKELRSEYVWSEEIIQVDQDWLDLECSIFEMLIALSRRLEFESSTSSEEWFWILLENLGIAKYNDKVYTKEIDQKVGKVLDKLNSRKYARNGEGGLFPLKNATKDQRKVELWYQMSSYLLEDDRWSWG